MSRNHEDFHKLKYTGAIDADGHPVEDPTLWERYLEAKYKGRGISLKTDDKVEYIEPNGKPSSFMRGPALGVLAAMGQVDRAHSLRRQLKYGKKVPLGAMDAKERIARLNAEGLEAAFVYPSLSVHV